MIREHERPAEERPERSEPKAPPPQALLALQQSAGNQAVGRMLQRALKIGTPGSQTPPFAGPEQIPTVKQQLAGALAARPPWVANWIDAEIDTLVTSVVNYEFDAWADVVDWLILKRLLDALNRLITMPVAHAGSAPRGDRTRALHQLLEQQRTAFAAAGEDSGVYTLFGIDYQLARNAPNHYYVTRVGRPKPVVYSGFKRSDARAVIEHLETEGPDAAYAGSRDHVDNFVCSFLAEPTRWPLEQVLNVLAVTNEEGGDTQMTGADSPGTLPMAAGSTWEPALQAIGRQTPRRALAHADSEGIKAIIDARLPHAASGDRLAGAVARKLGLVT